MTSPRDAFVAGAKDVAPALLGVVTFGTIVGVAAVDVGVPDGLAVGMSALVFAGVSQLAAFELMDSGAPVAVILLTVAVINLRLMMYSASIAPYFREFSPPWRGALGAVISDFAYALSVTRFDDDTDLTTRRWYYLGTALPVYVVWVLATAVGVALGARIPPWLELDFTIPLTFLALLFSAVEDRSSRAAAAVAGGIALVGSALPYGAGLLVGAVAGVAVAVIVSGRAEP